MKRHLDCDPSPPYNLALICGNSLYDTDMHTDEARAAMAWPRQNDEFPASLDSGSIQSLSLSKE